MGFTTSLRVSALALGMAAGTANAHGIPAPTSGDPYNATEVALTWNGSEGTATGGVLNNNTILAYHFDVTAAGLLDVFTNDHDDPNSAASLFIYKQDSVGTDWTLTQFNYAGAGPVTSPSDPNNIFGVHRTGYFDVNTVGTADAGVRANFDLGSYLALVVGSQGDIFGHVGTPLGAKLSEGLTWSWLSGDPLDLYTGANGLSDLTIKPSPGSLAVAGPSVEPVPVPGAVWLMGSVLAGFGAFGRKKSNAA